jgi:hypothetical protein
MAVLPTNTTPMENLCLLLMLCFKKYRGKYRLMKPCMVTLPFPILKSKGKYRMAEKNHIRQGYPFAT